VSASTTSLEPLFRPRSVAVLGASADATKLGGRTLLNLRERYRGRLYAVNGRGGEIHGLKAYKSVAELPEAPDLAVVSVPVGAALEAVEVCAAKGTRSAVLYTSGFAEIGAEGRKLQERLLEIARARGMRLLGPNCMGFLDIAQGTIASFIGPATLQNVVPGRVAILSQSGAIGTLALAYAQERGLGLSLWVTTGNQCDVDFSECLAYLAEDDETDVILAGLEGTADGDKLRAALRLAHAQRKPVVMLKIGRSEVGAAAVVSHTGSLAGNDAVYDAVFRAHGVYRAENFSELLDVAEVAAAGLYPENDRLGIVTVSGGVGIVMADEALARGLKLVPMPPEAQARLKAIVPFAAVRNPVDATTVMITEPKVLRSFLEETLESGGYGAVVVFLATLGMSIMHVERMLTALEGVRQAYPKRAIVFVMASTRETRARVEAAGFRVLDEPVRSVAALAALAHISAAWQRACPALPPPPPRARASGVMPAGEAEALAFLASAGIPTVAHRLASTREAAERAARELGLPVALKIASPDIAHKSDVGGIALDVASEVEAGKAFARLMRTVKRTCPEVRLEGVLVAPMVAGWLELILGAKRDAIFGPVVMLGLGGIYAETFADVSLRLAPLDAGAARAMIRELKGYPLLLGARGRPKLDLKALVGALLALSRLALAHRDAIESIDINPFMLLPKGGVALDALVVADPLRVRRSRGSRP